MKKRIDIVPIYWDTNKKMNRDFAQGLELFYDRIWFSDNGYERHLFGDDIDALLGEAAADPGFNWAVVFGYGTVFASQFKAANEIKQFILGIDQEILVAGHLMNKPGFYCGLHEQCFVVNLETYRRLDRPKFGPYRAGTHELQTYEAGPSVHNDYTPTYVRPTGGTAPAATRTGGWGLVDASLKAGLTAINLPDHVRESKIYFYPDDETDKLNRNLERLFGLEPLENYTQRAALAHLLLKKLGVHQTNQKGTFGFRERSNCVFFFNTQLLLPEQPWLGNAEGPLDVYSGPCSGFQDVAFLRHYGYHPGTELVYYDINPRALAMKKYVWENFDGRIEKLSRMIDAIRLHNPGEEVYAKDEYLHIKTLLGVFNNSEEEFFEHWQRMRQLNRRFERLNLLTGSNKLIESFDPKKKVLFNVTDIYLAQNELTYGKSGIDRLFAEMTARAAQLPQLILTGTNTDQVIFLQYASKL